MKRLLVTIAAGVAMTATIPAYVFNYGSYSNPRRWDFKGQSAPANSLNPATDAIRFYLASDAYSTTNTAAELNALRAAFGQWQSVPNVIIKFEDAGLVAPRSNINTSDGTNVLFFARTSMINGEDISGVLGRTYTRFSIPDNILLEADIIFNAYNRTWFTDINDMAHGGILIEAVAVHEIGHLLGLAHSPAGGASMLNRGAVGAANLQSGLTLDDITAVQHLYPITKTNTGAVKGTVTESGYPVLGAQVFVHDAASNVIAGAVTRSTGTYEVAMLPPGNYKVRVAPLDPASGTRLVAGVDIGSEYGSADTTFRPSANHPVAITANVTSTVNIAVSSLSPAFRITHIRLPSASSGSYTWSSLPTSMFAGQSSFYIGVGSANLPTANASLHITGDGLTVGSPIFRANAFGSGLNFISVLVSVAADATPGLRDFVVTQYGTNIAYANGFLEIESPVLDHNFDGLDDRFQRAYFPLYTAPNAGPAADPDNDGVNNYGESVAGTNPTNSASLLRIQKVTRTGNTAVVRWDSVYGKQYRVSYSTDPGLNVWMNVGNAVTAYDSSTQISDTSATNQARVYRVQPLP